MNTQIRKKEESSDDIDYSAGYPYPYPHSSHNKDSQELVDIMSEDIRINLKNGSTMPPFNVTKLEGISSKLEEQGWEKKFNEAFCYLDSKDGQYKMVSSTFFAENYRSFIHQELTSAATLAREELKAEIREAITAQLKPIEHHEDCLAITESEKYCDCGTKLYLEGHSSGIKGILSLPSLLPDNKEMK